MTFKIGGVDYTPYIAPRGIKWQLKDIESSKSGNTIDGTLHTGRIASKVQIDVTCNPLTSTNASIVLNGIQPEYVTVQYTDPMSGIQTKTMRVKNKPASFAFVRFDGVEFWDGISFTLEER